MLLDKVDRNNMFQKNYWIAKNNIQYFVQDIQSSGERLRGYSKRQVNVKNNTKNNRSICNRYLSTNTNTNTNTDTNIKYNNINTNNNNISKYTNNNTNNIKKRTITSIKLK